MSTPSDHRDDHDYLWDPAGAPVDPAVARVERAAGRLRFHPASAPLAREASRPRGRGRAGVRAALAAAAVLFVSVAVYSAWRWTWPEGRAWSMAIVAEAGRSRPAPAVLGVGQPLATGPSETARVDVARIGSMTVRPGAEIELRSTASNAHRLALARGTIDVSVWAPPGAVVVHTPAGRVVDVGCAFTLDVDDAGVSRVSVTSGWVQLDSFHGEMLVPAGASSEMRPDAPPLVPVYDDAVPIFRAQVRALERAEARVVDAAMLAAARPRDVLTLLALARTLPPELARPIIERAAVLSPPPAGVGMDAVATGDRDASWAWQDALPLPPPKRWWRNWRDGF